MKLLAIVLDNNGFFFIVIANFIDAANKLFRRFVFIPRNLDLYLFLKGLFLTVF